MKTRTLLVSAVLVVSSAVHAVAPIAPGTISTLAGIGPTIIGIGGSIGGYSGDNGPATAAALNNPCGMMMDAEGNLFFADSSNNRIRKISPSGIITTVAGSGAGYAGDGGPATAAKLRHPHTITKDPAGNFYIADLTNSRIRKIDPTGIITTMAGTGAPGFAGDGGPATAAQLNLPHGVFWANGNIYIADRGNHRIRRVDRHGTITTVAGSNLSGFGGDGGPATTARLLNPHNVFVDAGGTMYIADGGNNRIRQVSPQGVISTLAGNGQRRFAGDGGPATAASLADPLSVSKDSRGYIFISDSANNVVRQVDPAGIITTVAGIGFGGYGGDGGPATAALLKQPQAVFRDPAGHLYVGEFENHRIRKIHGIAPAGPPLPENREEDDSDGDDQGGGKPNGDTPDKQVEFYACGPALFNPARGEAGCLGYELSAPSDVEIRILDLRGREVRNLVDADRAANRYEDRWDGRDNEGREVASGAYHVFRRVNGQLSKSKFIVVK